MSLIVENISFNYGQNQVLKDLSFELKEGVYCCLLGSNGVGKSTLFRLVLKLNENYSGEIFVDGENIRQKTIKEMALSVKA